MSQENLETVRRAYEAITRRDFADFDRYAHPDIELHTHTQSPEAGVYRGKEAVRTYAQHLFEPFQSLRFEVETLGGAGDRIAIATTYRAVPRGGEQEIVREVFETWVMRDGLLAERRAYQTLEEALAAIGLSGQDAHAES